MDGRPREAFIGRSHWDLWPGTEAAPQGRLYKRVMDAGAPGSVETHYAWPDGRSAWIEIDAYPVPDGLAIFYRDITARKLAEEALHDLNATLERRVDERTRDLVSAEEALRQAQKMEAMGQLTGGVAHDFNNLLTPIVGALDMLQRRGVGGEREQRLIGAAVHSAERAKTLVQRLLAFARRQPLQPAAVDIAKLLANMAELIASTSGPQIRVSVDASEELPFARADQNQLEMALLNLSVNARDAMPNGGTLRISAIGGEAHPGDALGLAPGRYVRLSVADTGSGMDEPTLARATEPFFSTKGVGKGTGLGLSMVHGLVSQLGGALKIQSRQGVGTNVELWLPTTDDAPDAVVASTAQAPAATSAGVALLVDDEEWVRTSTAEMLADLGYEVVEAASAEEARRRLREGLRPDLLMTDHLMAGMNGTDLARLVRSQHPGVKVLVVSGYAESEGVAPDLARLTKPFREAELAKCLADLAGESAGR
jgi:signal transduction histidine kinase/CheY-like chemotaxis protein